MQEVNSLLRQAVQKVLSQQKQLETTHEVIQRQSAMIDELGKRYMSRVKNQRLTGMHIYTFCCC